MGKYVTEEELEGKIQKWADRKGYEPKEKEKTLQQQFKEWGAKNYEIDLQKKVKQWSETAVTLKWETVKATELSAFKGEATGIKPELLLAAVAVGMASFDFKFLKADFAVLDYTDRLKRYALTSRNDPEELRNRARTSIDKNRNREKEIKNYEKIIRENPDTKAAIEAAKEIEKLRVKIESEERKIDKYTKRIAKVRVDAEATEDALESLENSAFNAEKAFRRLSG
ncbi:hypothetical protein [Actinomadura macrotermitis]|uniref:Uncharacterized protein n=1 Tax=Actinomadura macrotermitis TaxID=2585200 RepID=A0A7K0C3T0_9ACTN|nr:hypothetical protein [Actinomadura macrotermitis]MQY07752.1 hypothetical protein [Actinomadura macrotermitis]